MVNNSTDMLMDDIDRPIRSTRRKRAPAKLNVNLTSLIDVTFLLLIYFMVATTITSGEQAYRLDLPQREGVSAADHVDPFTLDQEPLRIVVQSTGPGPAGCHLQIDGPYPQPATFEDLHAFLRQRQINDANFGGTMLFAPDHPIVIQPMHGTRWEHAIEAFNAAARARYTNITFGKTG